MINGARTRRAGPTRPILAVAHFPPPVHGMAVAVGRLVAELERHARVRRVRMSAPSHDRRTVRYHLVRMGRVLYALLRLVLGRPRAKVVFFSCDGGWGMLYTAALAGAARILRYRIFLQHHTYGYIDRPSRVMGALVLVLGPECRHLVACPSMGADFAAVYPGATTQVVGVAQGISVIPGPVRKAARDRLVLGFLGNVTIDKGVDLALGTARRLADRGVPVEIQIAGPVIDGEATRLITEAATDTAFTVRNVGPVHGAERDAFLDGIDAFLFPSRLSESFGLVAWEAMGRGVPLVAYGSGCLSADAAGDGARVLPRGSDFVDGAVAVLHEWWSDEELMAVAGESARRAAEWVVRSSQAEVAHLCREMSG